MLKNVGIKSFIIHNIYQNTIAFFYDIITKLLFDAKRKAAIMNY